MKKNVLYNCPYIHGPGAIRFIVRCWEEGFVREGYDFHVCEDAAALPAKLEELAPSILYCDIVATPIEQPELRAALTRARARGTKVVVNVFWPLQAQPPARAEALRRHDVADVYCGEREPDSMGGFETETGKRYRTMAQAANPRYHFPAEPQPRFAYDVVFLGAKLPHKRWFNEEIILPCRRRYRTGLFGAGWTLRDNALRAVSKGARLAGWRGLAQAADRGRFSISDEEENVLYSSAKICLNFHEREPDNSQPHHIVNQRTFKIAACGGFQIVDPVAALGRYFNSSEIVTAGFDAREWLEKIDYYLRHDHERRAIQTRATERAQREHLAQHRVKMLERWFAGEE
jgi:hypothetical protein